MSQQRSGGTQYANSNINTALSRAGSASSAQTQPTRYGPGLVSLGAPKRPRQSAGGPAGKLSIPKPVNLPSLKKENSGNDPNTQLVPTSAGARGSWKQPEEQQPAPDTTASALTAGSNWAGPGKPPGPYWQPPEGPYPTAPALQPRDRHLNPHEYPTLSAAAAPRQQFSRQPVPSLPPSTGQGTAKWDEDERQLPPAPVGNPRVPPAEWTKEQDDGRGQRPTWDDSRLAGPPSQDWRSGLNDGPAGHSDLFSNRPQGWHGDSADHWQPQGRQSNPGFGRTQAAGYSALSGGLPPRGYNAGARGNHRFLQGEFPALPIDPQLFPPPPSSKLGHPSAQLADTAISAPTPVVAAADPEREAFEAELEKVAADMEKERQRKLEEKQAPPPPPPESETEEHLDVPSPPIPLAQSLSVGSPPSISAVSNPAASQEIKEDPAAALEIARARAVAARAQREAAADEAEKRRIEAARAKLADLEERISRRKAEEAAKAALAEELEAAEKAALEQDVVAANSTTAQPVVESSDESLLFTDVPAAVSRSPSSTAMPPTHAPMTHASLDVNLSGSVAKDLETLAEAVAEVDMSVISEEVMSPESPVRPAATNQAVEAAIKTLELQEVEEQPAPSAWNKAQTAPPSQDAIIVTTLTTGKDLGDGLEDETTEATLQQSSPGDADWDSEGEAEPPTILPTPPAPMPEPRQNAKHTYTDPNPTSMPSTKVQQPPTSWRKIVSGDTGPHTTELSPREAAEAAALAAQEKPLGVSSEGQAPMSARGRRDDRRERGRANRDPREGERTERTRGGRGRDRNRERGRGREGRRREDQSVTSEEPVAKPGAEVEVEPGVPGEARQRGFRAGQRGQGRTPRESMLSNADGATPQGAPTARSRGRPSKSISPRSSAPSAHTSFPNNTSQIVPTRIVKPPGLPHIVPPSVAPPPAVPTEDTSTGTSMQAIADVLTDTPSAPPLPPMQPPAMSSPPPIVWGNFTTGPTFGPQDTGVGPLHRRSILDPVGPSVELNAPGVVGSPAPADRAVDRPTSAAGAVGRPQRLPKAPGRSNFDPTAPHTYNNVQPEPTAASFEGTSSSQFLPAAELPNGMPVLPADLTDESPVMSSARKPPGPAEGQPEPQQQSNINFGGLSRVPAANSYGTGAPLFSHGGGLWQSPAINNSQSHPTLSTSLQMATSHSLDSFLPSAGSGGFSGAFIPAGQGAGGSPLGNTGGNAGFGSAPQFGAFGGAFGQGIPQFGQLQGSYGQPFVPTGKQPDWSTGPIPGAGSGPSASPAFSRSLDSVVGSLPGFQQHSNGPAAPRPPGLNRQSGPPPTANGAAPHIAPIPQSHPLHVGDNRTPSQIPPGLGTGNRGGPAGGLPQHAPLDAAAALPDDVMGSENTNGIRISSGGGGKGLGGRGMSNAMGRGRGVDLGRRAGRGRMDLSRANAAPLSNPQGARGMGQVPRGGMNAFVGGRAIVPPIGLPRPPAMPGAGIPPQMPMPPLGAPPGSESARAAPSGKGENAGGHPQRRGRGGRGGNRGDRRSSSGNQPASSADQQHHTAIPHKPVVKDGAAVNTTHAANGS